MLDGTITVSTSYTGANSLVLCDNPHFIGKEQYHTEHLSDFPEFTEVIIGKSRVCLFL